MKASKKRLIDYVFLAKKEQHNGNDSPSRAFAQEYQFTVAGYRIIPENNHRPLK
jgi:hypothetical protein